MEVGPVGENHKFKVGGRFAAGIEMRGISALGDALVGARRWDSSAVLMERDLVLGTEDGKAWEYIERVRGTDAGGVEGVFRKDGSSRVSRVWGECIFQTIQRRWLKTGNRSVPFYLFAIVFTYETYSRHGSNVLTILMASLFK